MIRFEVMNSESHSIDRPTWSGGCRTASIKQLLLKSINLFFGQFFLRNVKRPFTSTSNQPHGGSVVDIDDFFEDQATFSEQQQRQDVSILLLHLIGGIAELEEIVEQ